MKLGLKEINDLFIEKGIKPTYHRVLIYDFLQNNRIHPTAEEIYKNIIKVYSQLSKATVYNTLDLLSKKKIIKVIPLTNQENHYDDRLDFHAHFICKKCGHIYDVSVDELQLSGIEKFDIEEKEVILTGICKKCKTEEK